MIYILIKQKEQIPLLQNKIDNEYKNFLNYKKLAVKTYTKLLKLDNSKGFSLSDKTINSLVNNGSLSADDAIIFVKKMKHQVGNCTNLEIIILDEIE